MNLLQVKNLSISFNTPDGVEEVVRDISFSIEKGQTLALVGESGAGKSLVSRSILRLLPSGATVQKGQILFAGKDILTFDEKKLRELRGKNIAMIFQDPLTSLNPLHHVSEQISETLLAHGQSNQIKARVLELLKLVQLNDSEDIFKAYPHQLSGGQRQRIMLAMAIANKPSLLVADEPTTALDASVQLEILQLLKKLQKELHMAVLLISHDLGLVNSIADHVCVMRKGELLESAPAEKIFTIPSHPYTKELLAVPELHPLSGSTSQELALQVKNMLVEFPRKKTGLWKKRPALRAVNHVSFDLVQGECLGIVGESGSGKSSLALALLRLIPSKASICMFGQELQNLSYKELAPLRKKLQVVFQDPYASLNPRMNVESIVKEGLGIHHKGIAKELVKTMVAQTLEEVGLPINYAERFPHELSGGERQRVAIARALILKPEILILDEPTSSLDRSLQFQIISLLQNLQERYAMSCIYISHDLDIVQRFCHRLLVLHKGVCLEQGSTKEIFKNPKTEYMRNLIKAGLACTHKNQQIYTF